MEIDNDENVRGASEISKNGLYLYPVFAQASGEGLPYAPVDWPEPGDIWRWKVGNRVAASGHFMDRYLYLPERLQSVPKERSFASKLSVEQYVQKIGADVKAFFSSFSWKIPSRDQPELKGLLELLPLVFSFKLFEMTNHFPLLDCRRFTCIEL